MPVVGRDLLVNPYANAHRLQTPLDSRSEILVPVAVADENVRHGGGSVRVVVEYHHRPGHRRVVGEHAGDSVQRVR